MTCTETHCQREGKAAITIAGSVVLVLCWMHVLDYAKRGQVRTIAVR